MTYKKTANEPGDMLHDAFCTFVDAGFAALASWLKQSSRNAVIDVDFVVSATEEMRQPLALTSRQHSESASAGDAVPHE